jgi:hypothetical protein
MRLFAGSVPEFLKGTQDGSIIADLEHAFAPCFLTIIRPNGHSEKPANLNACSPNGIPMIVMNITSPAIT